MGLLRKFATTAVCVSTLMTAPAALAGSRSTYMTGWAVGHHSNTWSDPGTGATNTTVSHSECYLAPGGSGDPRYSNHNLRLERKTGTFSWQDHGARTTYCGTANWGIALAGTWRFELTQINGGNYSYYQRLNVNYVTIIW